MIAQGAAAQAAEKSVIDTFNIKLIARITAFKAANAGVRHIFPLFLCLRFTVDYYLQVTTYMYDANADLVQFLDHPNTYGFKDATSYGGDVDEMWCNNYHVSPGVHNYFGQGATILLHYGGFLP